MTTGEAHHGRCLLTCGITNSEHKLAALDICVGEMWEMSVGLLLPFLYFSGSLFYAHVSSLFFRDSFPRVINDSKVIKKIRVQKANGARSSQRDKGPPIRAPGKHSPCCQDFIIRCLSGPGQSGPTMHCEKKTQHISAAVCEKRRVVVWLVFLIRLFKAGWSIWNCYV